MGGENMSEFSTDFVAADDKPQWRPLFQGYADFYGVPMDDAIADRVWAWLLDPAHELEGLLARDAAGQAVGMVHVRRCPRSLGGGDVGFLGDVVVRPAARGSGAGDALFERLAALPDERG